MSRWALMGGDTVITVIEQDVDPGNPWIDCTGTSVGPGWTRVNDAWVPAPAPRLQWPAFVWVRRMTAAERIATRTLANTDPIANDFIHLLDWAVASGTPIYADDADFRAGLVYLSANPAGSPVLAAGRSDALVQP